MVINVQEMEIDNEVRVKLSKEAVPINPYGINEIVVGNFVPQNTVNSEVNKIPSTQFHSVDKPDKELHVKIEDVLTQNNLDGNLISDFIDYETCEPASLNDEIKVEAPNPTDEKVLIKKEEVFVKQEEMHFQDEPLVHGDETGKTTRASTDRSSAIQSDANEKQVFKCKKCHYVGLKRKNLVQHMVCHSARKRFKCKTCDYSSYSSSNLKVHNRRHTGEKPFKCSECNFCSAYSSRISSHKQIHIKGKVYRCDHCSFIGEHKGSLQNHMITHVNELYNCKFCAYTTYSRHCIRHHIWRHRQKVLECDLCKYPSTTKRGLNNHLKRQHNNVDKNTYSCRTCFYQTKNADELTQHQKTHTTLKRSYRCDKCKYNSPDIKLLIDHMKMHQQ